ncbi:hypothetical protein NGM37_58850 [Streptomyces sp. TRM76130]|nr:hypothetical protein [Streptomyces sp. TRM76130]
MNGNSPGRREGPARRRRSGLTGRRFPRTGTEPVTARSPLGLRLLLSGLFLPVFGGAAVLFGVWAAGSGPDDSPDPGVLTALAAVCATLALFAVIDLLVVMRKLRRERGDRSRVG